MTVATNDKQVIATNGTEVFCSPPATESNKPSPCSHEEADTRMMVHMVDAIEKGHNSLMFRTTDTDVIVLAVPTVVSLDLNELWVSYGTGKNHKILPAHLFAKILDTSKSKCLPVFHALTGCVTSLFTGHGKKTTWKTYDNFPYVTSTFMELESTPSTVSNESLAIIER